MDFLSSAFGIVGTLVAVLSFYHNVWRNRLPREAKEFVARFRNLIEASQLNDLQFLDEVPKDWGWSQATISKPQLIYKEVKSEHISWLSQSFGVPKEWLLGEEDAPSSDLVFGYKKPEAVRSMLDNKGWLTSRLKMTVLAEEYQSANKPIGRFILVFSHPLNSKDEQQPIWHHARFATTLSWGHGQARFDAKAIARWFAMEHKHLGRIPIVPVDWKQFKAIENGEVLVGGFVPQHPTGLDSFEDRVLTPKHDGEGESCMAIETEELEQVLGYYKQRFATV